MNIQGNKNTFVPRVHPSTIEELKQRMEKLKNKISASNMGKIQSNFDKMKFSMKYEDFLKYIDNFQFNNTILKNNKKNKTFNIGSIEQMMRYLESQLIISSNQENNLERELSEIEAKTLESNTLQRHMQTQINELKSKLSELQNKYNIEQQRISLAESARLREQNERRKMF